LHILHFIEKYALLLLGLIITAFIIIKVPYLNYPYYWDEAWVYAPAVQYMAEHGPSLLPSSMPVDLSRGHPLLFQFLASIWVQVFGDSFISMHSFPLLISVLLLFSLYFFTARISNKIYAIAAVIVFSFLKIFYVQSVFVLPEILFSLLALWTLWGYVERNFWLMGIAGALLLLTKESGLVVIFGLIILEVCFALRSINFSKSNAIVLLTLICSLLPFGLFLFLQHQTHGWFFYPEHTGFVNTNTHDILVRMIDLGPTVFGDNGIFAIVSLALISLLYWTIKYHIKLTLKITTAIAAGIFVTLFMIKDLWTNNDLQIFLLLLLVVSGIFIFFLLPRSYYKNNKFEYFIWSAITIIFGYMIFTAMNFFSYRYLMIIFPLLVMLSMISMYSIQIPVKYLAIPIIFILVFLFPHLLQKGNFGDCEPSYINMVRLQQEIVEYMTKHSPQEAKIQASFLTKVSLNEPSAGYISENNAFHNFVWDGSHDYLISVNNEFQNIVQENPHEVAEQIQLGEAKVKIYRKK
jgi:4-amino-4-deoxy-L-arabinose transferase-like glycosyltransferase